MNTFLIQVNYLEVLPYRDEPIIFKCIYFPEFPFRNARACLGGRTTLGCFVETDMPGECSNCRAWALVVFVVLE